MMNKFLSILFFILFLIGCGNSNQNSNTLGLGASQNGVNIATLFGSPAWQEGNEDDPDSTIHIPPGPGLPGVLTDIREMNKIFSDSRYNFHFSAVSHDRATVEDIFGMTAKNVKNADSLLWFFTGHGGSGYLFAEEDDTEENGAYTFSQVAAVIKKARGDKPLKRLIVLLDACHSGEFVNGDQPIINKKFVNEEGWEEEALYQPLLAAYDDKLYEQAFVMASSLTSETSIDLGAEKGGAFTYSMRQSFTELLNNNPRATFKDFAIMTTQKTKAIAGHTPVYRAFPEPSVINDYMFIY